MNPETARCDDDRIARFLRHELSDDEQHDLAQHLDVCPDCTQRLESETAENPWWRAAAEFLADGPLEFETVSQATTEGDTPPPNLMVQQVLDHLAPTDDPRMLGRLGGYEIAGVVGSGGMGVVLKAFDAALDRYVAIKTLSPMLSASGAARQRFSREARAAAAVVHDNVSEIYGVDEANGLPYLVMPYVRGMSLQQRLDRHGALSAAEVLRIARQTAAGLAAAHAQGIVHRDIKPANILLSEGVERVQITDFGLARAADDASLTRTGSIAGTPQYMSPEQARGEKVDCQSDLFSLGSVMYAMCTGRSPFRAETSYGVLRRIIDETPTPIREINPEIPEWLCAIVARLMAKRPEERYTSAEEVASLLEDCLAHVQHPTTGRLPESLVGSVNKPARATSRFSLRSRPAIGVLVMTASVLFALLGLLAWQSTEAPDIAGRWTGEGWGRVVLEEKRPGEFEGTYSDTFGEERGVLHVVWSRIDRRFNGTWREGDDRFGEVSLRLSDNVVRGAWTTDAKSRIQPGTPRLADLTWIRASSRPVSPTGDKLPPTSTGPPSDSTAGRSLIDAVRAFNEQYADHPIGRTQPPLTDDEVVACLRWKLGEAERLGEDSGFLRAVEEIVEQQQLPPGWRLNASTALDGVDGERFEAWVIRLHATSTAEEPRRHIIRQRLLSQRDNEGQPIELPEVEGEQFADATPLAAAIHEFNETHRSLGGVAQPPLTEEEVVATIRFMKARRNELPLTNGEFADFQRIAETRHVPSDVQFELLPNFSPGDGNRYRIWSVRIVLPRTTKPDWTYAAEIRKQFIDARPLGSKDIHWGPVAENGLQVGVVLEPRSSQYVVGQEVVPHFFVRNTSKKYVRITLPRVMLNRQYRQLSAVDPAGREIAIEQNPKPGGVVGAMSNPLSPGGMQVLQGLPIRIGDVPRGSADVVVRAKAGQGVRLKFSLPNFSDNAAAGDLLETSVLSFTVIKYDGDAAGGEEEALTGDPSPR
ncbi:MAG: protein kinase [Pirellulaceae bacterium]